MKPTAPTWVSNRSKWNENYRRRHPDRIRESNRRWFASAKGKATRKKYLSNLKVKTASRKSKLAWAKRNQEKRKAHVIVGNAIRDGRLKRKPCERCGKRAQAHHPDYSKPLKVRWLCTRHHSDEHRGVENGEGINNFRHRSFNYRRVFTALVPADKEDHAARRRRSEVA